MFQAVLADWREALGDVLADHRLAELEAFVAGERAAHANHEANFGPRLAQFRSHPANPLSGELL